MRIGFFTDTYAQVNGVTVIIKMLETQLRKLGHEVHIFAPRSTHEEDKKNPFLHTSEAVRFLPSPEYKLSPFPIFLFDLPPLDIVHIHSPISLGISGIFAARRLGIPAVGTVHTLIPEFWKVFMNNFIPYIGIPVVKDLLNLVVDTAVDVTSVFAKYFSWRYYIQFFKRCDVTTVPSKYAQDICREKGLETIILPNGIDFSKFDRIDKEFIKKFNISKKNKYLISVGRLSEEKKVETSLRSFIEIHKNFPNLRYLIVGDGSMHSTLTSMAEKAGITEKVIFTGYLNNEELAAAYQNSHIYITSSPFETQGLSIIEALYFHLPIIGIKSGATEDLNLQDNRIGLFHDGTVENLANQIKTMLKLEKMYKEYKKNAKPFSLKYNMKDFVKNQVNLYEELINKK